MVTVARESRPWETEAEEKKKKRGDVEEYKKSDEPEYGEEKNTRQHHHQRRMEAEGVVPQPSLMIVCLPSNFSCQHNLVSSTEGPCPTPHTGSSSSSSSSPGGNICPTLTLAK